MPELAAPDLAFVALGANLGTPRASVLAGMDRLQSLSVAPLLRSSLWETEPIDCPPGSPPFINAMVGLVPGPAETPETLLAKLQAWEREMGRPDQRARNSPRTLDLDLIAFGREVRSSPTLTLPHPRAHQRAFVLAPLNEIAPHLVLPGQAKSVHELLQQLPPGPTIRKDE